MGYPVKAGHFNDINVPKAVINLPVKVLAAVVLSLAHSALVIPPNA